MTRAFRITWRHSKSLSIRFTMKIMMWWWQITISSVCWKYPSFSSLACGTKPGGWDKLSYFLKEWKSTGNLHHICKKHVVYCYTFHGVVTDSFAVYVFSGGGKDLGGGLTYLLTVKPVYNGPVYSRSPCILRSPENFPKFSVALYFLQSWPVYNGHLTIPQWWPISRVMSPPPFPQLQVRFFTPRIVWITFTSG